MTKGGATIGEMGKEGSRGDVQVCAEEAMLQHLQCPAGRNGPPDEAVEIWDRRGASMLVVGWVAVDAADKNEMGSDSQSSQPCFVTNKNYCYLPKYHRCFRILGSHVVSPC